MRNPLDRYAPQSPRGPSAKLAIAPGLCLRSPSALRAADTVPPCPRAGLVEAFLCVYVLRVRGFQRGIRAACSWTPLVRCWRGRWALGSARRWPRTASARRPRVQKLAKPRAWTLSLSRKPPRARRSGRVVSCLVHTILRPVVQPPSPCVAR